MRFLFVRPEICPWLVCSHIRLPSDSTSRWTPLPSAISFPLPGGFGTNPLETCAARRPTQKNGKETVVTVFFPFFTIISFFNFTQLLVFHTYKADIRIRFATCQWELYRTEFSVQKIPTCEQLLQFYHMFCKKVFRGSNS